MKRLALMLLLSGPVFGCPKGCELFKDTCACDIAPEIAKPVEPSDEKPPSDKMPSWQREGIAVSTATNMAFDDAKADREKAEADQAGKLAAGIR